MRASHAAIRFRAIAVGPVVTRRRLAVLVALLVVLVLAGAARDRTHPVAAPRSGAPDVYGRMPVAFVANRGQSDARVRYAAQGAGYGFFVTRDELVLSLARASGGITLGL
jgi:hypothetical protein